MYFLVFLFPRPQIEFYELYFDAFHPSFKKSHHHMTLVFKKSYQGFDKVLQGSLQKTSQI